MNGMWLPKSGDDDGRGKKFIEKTKSRRFFDCVNTVAFGFYSLGMCVPLTGDAFVLVAMKLLHRLQIKSQRQPQPIVVKKEREKQMVFSLCYISSGSNNLT